MTTGSGTDTVINEAGAGIDGSVDLGDGENTSRIAVRSRECDRRSGCHTITNLG